MNLNDSKAGSREGTGVRDKQCRMMSMAEKQMEGGLAYQRSIDARCHCQAPH
jgi:hypothetical protein